MNNNTHDHSVDEQTSNIARRTFLGSSMLGGLGLALSLSGNAEGKSISDDPFGGDCLRVTASDLLAMFSTLAWKLPAKLQAAEDARKDEEILYVDFDTHYRKLSKLAKALNIRCSNLTKKDPRKKAAAELAAVTDRNVKTPRPGSRDSDVTYMHISALVVENQYLSRTVNEVLPQTAPFDDDNKLICEMLAEIDAMDKIKTGLDVARAKSRDAFKDFTSSVKAVHTNIVLASDEAAKADRGKGSKATAVEKIDEAKKVLDAMIKDSTNDAKSSMPKTLQLLLDIPRNLLENKLPNPSPVTRRLRTNDVQFTNASYTPSLTLPVSRWGQVYDILVECVFPSNPISVGILTTACCLTLDSYSDDPPRQDMVANTLLAWALSTEAKCKDVVARIVNVK